jgi:outer membrane protein, heavy metal efflux system
VHRIKLKKSYRADRSSARSSPPFGNLHALAAKILIGCTVLSGLISIDSNVYAQSLNQVSNQVANQYSLQQTLSRVETYNHAVYNARLLSDAAAADVRRANVAPNPSLSAGASNTTAGRYRPRETDQIVRIEQTFERGNKRALRIANAQELQNASQADISETIRQQKVLAALAYADLGLAQRLKVLFEENESNFKRLVDGAQRRLKAGDIANADVSRLSVEFARATNDVRSAQNNVAQAQYKLALLLGLGTIQIIATDPLPDSQSVLALELLFSTESRTVLVNNALANRSDLIAAKARVQAQEKALLLAKSLQTRDVSLGAQTERAPGFGGRVFGVTASIPLLTNNDYSAEALRAAADLSIAQADEEHILTLMRTEIESSYTQLLAARDRLNLLLKTTLPEVIKASQAIEYAYTKGAATLTDLFDARRQFNTVQAETALAQGEFAKALFAYKASVNSAIE